MELWNGGMVGAHPSPHAPHLTPHNSHLTPHTSPRHVASAERNAVRAVRDAAKNGPLGHGILPALPGLLFGQHRAQRDKHLDPNGLRPQTVLRVGDIISLAVTADSYGAEPRDVGLFQVDPFSNLPECSAVRLGASPHLPVRCFPPAALLRPLLRRRTLDPLTPSNSITLP